MTAIVKYKLPSMRKQVMLAGGTALAVSIPVVLLLLCYGLAILSGPICLLLGWVVGKLFVNYYNKKERQAKLASPYSAILNHDNKDD